MRAVRRLALAIGLGGILVGAAALFVPTEVAAAKPDCPCERVIIQNGSRCILSSCSPIDCTYVCRG